MVLYVQINQLCTNFLKNNKLFLSFFFFKKKKDFSSPPDGHKWLNRSKESFKIDVSEVEGNAQGKDEERKIFL